MERTEVACELVLEFFRPYVGYNAYTLKQRSSKYLDPSDTLEQCDRELDHQRGNGFHSMHRYFCHDGTKLG